MRKIVKDAEISTNEKINRIELEKMLTTQGEKAPFSTFLPDLCSVPGSNWGPIPLQGSALPTELTEHVIRQFYHKSVTFQNLWIKKRPERNSGLSHLKLVKVSSEA